MREKLENLIGTIVYGIVDRPLGSCHPKHIDIVYGVNYGFIPDIMARDGEYQDAYFLGADIPLIDFQGVVIAIIHRLNDIEDKLVVAPIGKDYSIEEIEAQVYFQEKYFKHVIIK